MPAAGPRFLANPYLPQQASARLNSATAFRTMTTHVSPAVGPPVPDARIVLVWRTPCSHPDRLSRAAPHVAL